MPGRVMGGIMVKKFGFRKSGAGLCALALTAGILAAVPLSARAEIPEGQQDEAAESRLVTIAGVPGNDYADGETTQARMASPLGFEVWGGDVWIADTDNNLIRRYSDGGLSTVAGQIVGRDAYGNALGGALFDRPADCVHLPDGRLVVADRDHHAIRVVGRTGVYTLNGGAEEGYAEGVTGQARFSCPSGLALGADGSIYVADTGNHCIRVLNGKGTSALVAGVPGQGGYADGAAGEAMFLEPTAIAVAEDGSIYVADTGNQRIRRIYDGQVTTVAGGDDGYYLDTEYRAPGLRDGQGTEARFRFPGGICMAGPVVIVADTGNHVIRAVSPSGEVRVIAGCQDAGYEDGASMEAQLNSPGDVEWVDGTLYILDSGNSALRSMPFSPEEWLRSLESAGNN